MNLSFTGKIQTSADPKPEVSWSVFECGLMCVRKEDVVADGVQHYWK